ncbi:MucBP domain-containing protein [Rothia nasimurium]|uniref:MucBP domain-containing protein n=1 Tax=Rothia nasimurium TaxID=85336 RepID=UPI002351AF1E|nr:MucBP domain-containing protein [Rothia nasimurium]
MTTPKHTAKRNAALITTAAVVSGGLIFLPQAAEASEASDLPVALSSNGARMSIAELNQQISWANFKPAAGQGQVGVWNYGTGNAFQVGSVYTHEMMYAGDVVRITAEVVELKPYQDDDVNWNRAENTEAKVVATEDSGTYSHLTYAGIPMLNEDGSKALGNLGSNVDGGNIGITFNVTAVRILSDGSEVPVRPSIIVADGEMAGVAEFQAYSTTGTAWDLLAEAKRRESYPSFRDYPDSLTSDWFSYNNRHYNINDWKLNPNDPNRGIGTSLVGPLRTEAYEPKEGPHPAHGSVPIVETTSTSTQGMNVSIFVNSPGQQQVRLGFVLFDQGDAPESYGSAKHLIADNPQIPNYQNPKIGRVGPDFRAEDGADVAWKSDDMYDAGDESITDFTAAGNTDEDLAFYFASNTRFEYQMMASRSNDPAKSSYLRSWVDTNNDGTFEVGEASEPVRVDTYTAEGQVGAMHTLAFNNPHQIVDTSLNYVGVRARIADNFADIQHPTGFASSGEVEDFMVRVIHPPRGTQQFTETPQNTPVTSTPIGFNAYGNLKDNFSVANALLGTSEYKIVGPDGTLYGVGETYTLAGEGSYVLNADGTVTFTPEPQFVGTAKGVAIRAYDENGNDTGWTSNTTINGLENVNDIRVNGARTMDAIFVPTVVGAKPSATVDSNLDRQGAPQTSEIVYTPGSEFAPLDFSTTTFVDGDGNPISGTTIPAMKDGVQVGTYTLDPTTGQVTFQPNPDFVGSPDPARVRISDRNGEHATGIFAPHVFPVAPAADGKETGDLQGRDQSATPTFTESDGKPIVPSASNPVRFIDPATGQPTDETTIPATDETGKQIGTYTVDPLTGKITFTPNKDFTGTPVPATVTVKDKYGVPVTATYTPTVFTVTPFASDDVTTGLQGREQTGRLDFQPGHEEVPLDFSTTTFVDGDGNPISGTTIPAMKDGVQIGTYTLDPATGQVTFKPNPDFVGTPDPARVQVKDINGTPATAVYTLSVTEVTGDVLVTYKDTTGKEIPGLPPVTDTKDKRVGTDYDTTDHKPAEFTAVDGSRYVLVPSLTEGDEKGTVAEGETTVAYVYQKVGSWITNIPGQPVEKIPFPFDPENPGNPMVPGDGVTIPYVPGLTPVDPGTNQPLTPVDPEDPTKGYVPPTPSTPGEDLNITYVPNASGSVTVKYQDVDSKEISVSVIDTEAGTKVGEEYDTTDHKPTEIVTEDGSRYVLVPSLTKGDEKGKVTEVDTEVIYVYQKVANWVPMLPGVPVDELPKIPFPFDPANPDQPVTPTPDQTIPHVPGFVPVDPRDKTPLNPVDPNDPKKGYIPPAPSTPGEELLIPYQLVATGSVIVNYVSTGGDTIKAPVTDTAGAAVGTEYTTTDNKPETIMLSDGTRYVLIPGKTKGAETGTVTEGTTEVTYVYAKVGYWEPKIPGVPDENQPKIPYPFDPANPDKPVTPTPDTVIPWVPDHTPVDPEDPTKPLTPVDPEDPTKGYIPPTPSTPGANTPIPYVPVVEETPAPEAKVGSVVVRFTDTEGNAIKDPAYLVTDSPVGGSYDTTGTKAAEIIAADGSRYVLVPSKTIGTEKGEVTEGTTEVTYVYQKVGNWVPKLPGVPVEDLPKIPYPFDPANPDQPVTPTPDTVIPYVPGYTPVDPQDPTKPLTPVDPEDPTKGYVPPTPGTPGEELVIDYVKDADKVGSVIVKYQDKDGNAIPGLNQVTDTRDAVVGTDYSTEDHKVTEVTTADGSRYVLIAVEGTEKGQVVEGETTVTYIYQKVGHWIPQLPGVPVENLPKIPFPFDPSNPDNPSVPGEGDVVPYVPGFVPVDPVTGEPLQPVDPNDPKKGYIPPTPANPGDDLVIPYKPVENKPVDPTDPADPGVPNQPITPAPGDGQPGNPGDGQPGTPGDGQPGTPGDGQPGDGQPGDGQPGTPGDGQPGDGQPGTPGDGQPGDGQPGTPGDGQGKGKDGGNAGGSGDTGNTGGKTGGNAGGSTGGNTGDAGQGKTPAPAGKSSSGNLANTGAQVGTAAGLGALLLGLGAALTRRNRRKDS